MAGTMARNSEAASRSSHWRPFFGVFLIRGIGHNPHAGHAGWGSQFDVVVLQRALLPSPRFIHPLYLLLVPNLVEGRQWYETLWDTIGTNDYEFPEDFEIKDGATFEYIVVGAGAAGSAAAARLALSGRNVLLVEAGGDPPAAAKVPGGVTSLVGSEYDWSYKTKSNNKSCLSTTCFFFRGKCLGGSTSINHMLYTRGNRQDFEYDLPGWTWNDIKPYFLRYEGLDELDRLPLSSKKYHNTSGLMKLSFMNDSKSPWHPRIINGYRNLNFPYNDDVNGEAQIGVGIIPGYVHKGERMSTARAYLARDDVKLNLKVAKDTFCVGVIIENKVAIGVRLTQKNRKIIQVYASKEVILSAGAIGTPQILMLSGIGPAQHLKEKAIPLQVDLPVGENMIEHFFPALFVLADQSTGIAGDLATLAGRAADVLEYVTNRVGSLSSIGLVDIGVFVNTSCYEYNIKVLDKGAGCDVPNLQILHVYIDRHFLTISRSRLEVAYNRNIANQLAAAGDKYGIILLTPLILTPHSRGSIRLASRDPFQGPEIYPNFLSDERDLDQSLRAIYLIEDLLKTPAFKEKGAKLLRFKLDCPDYENDGEEYWKCYSRHLTSSGLHAVGTAALGTVLDERLRVRNISRLRVADISAMPKIPKGSTEASAIALGERVVDFILEDNVN